MLNEQEWQQQHCEFLSESETLLLRSEECLAHLELIADDRDAIDCLLASLRNLTVKADVACVERIAAFTRQLHDLLDAACPRVALQGDPLHTLKSCITLLAWQIEFIDRRSGQMPLDDSEQRELLERLAFQCGLDSPQTWASQAQSDSLTCQPHA
jgi:chemotaxis protein histidine kinase CheA